MSDGDCVVIPPSAEEVTVQIFEHRTKPGRFYVQVFAPAGVKVQRVAGPISPDNVDFIGQVPETKG